MSLATEAHQRHAHYLEVLRQLGNLYRDRSAVSNLFFQLDAEWAQIATARRWAARHDSAVARKCCSDYARCAATLLSLRQSASERIDWLEVALAGAIDVGDRVAQAEHLGNLGIAYEDLRQYDESHGYLAEALQIDGELQDERMEQVHVGQLGLALIGLAIHCLTSSICCGVNARPE
jgi:tetratricopeptide (TPR) repeat protein